VKKRMDIERALQWAFREELPKVAASPGARIRDFRPSENVGSMWDAAERVDNMYGVTPDLYASGDPHPDALTIGDAVRWLDACPVVLPADWNPVTDLGLDADETREAVHHGIGQATFIGEDGERRLKRGLLNIVRMGAVLFTRPIWEAEPVTREIVRGQNGKELWFRKVRIPYTTADGGTAYNEVETNGIDPKTRKPHLDAYRKVRLEPDPAPVVAERAEYECWAHALNALMEEMPPLMTSIEVEASSIPVRPWETGDSRTIRVLPDLRPVQNIPGRPDNMTRPGGETDRRNLMRYMHLSAAGDAMRRGLSTRPKARA